jgi:hypothetical protein
MWWINNFYHGATDTSDGRERLPSEQAKAVLRGTYARCSPDVLQGLRTNRAESSRPPTTEVAYSADADSESNKASWRHGGMEGDNEKDSCGLGGGC